jgi:hypothetical protein
MFKEWLSACRFAGLSVASMAGKDLSQYLAISLWKNDSRPDRHPISLEYFQSNDTSLLL